MVTSSPDDYLQSTREDVALLPKPLPSTARIIDRGEAEWPQHLAEAAIRALIGLGRVVNVLEWAEYQDGVLIRSDPISTYEGTDPEANLRFVLPGVAALPPGHTAVICWYPDARA